MPTSDPAGTVTELIDRWRSRRYDEIGELVIDDVVLAPPGAGERIVGREPFVNSFRDYDRTVETLVFAPCTPVVDDFGAFAVTTVAFHVEYRRDIDVYKEDGTDTYVLREQDGTWKVVWRSMHIASSTR